MGTVLSVNVGGIRQFEYRGRPAQSAIWKAPVDGPVRASGVNLAGDDQADREAHGGADKAIYAYASEDYRWWESELERSLDPGQFGENLTTEGLDVNGAVIGERWAVGTTVLEVSEPRVPCWRFAVRMDDKHWPKRFTQAMRPGSYLRIVEEGEIGTGDAAEVVERPDHDLTIGDVFRIFARDREQVGRFLDVPQLPESWKEWARRLAQR